MAFLKDQNGNFIKDGDGNLMTVPDAGTVDQHYDPTSINAQSGVAVAEAVTTKSTATNLTNGTSTGSLKQQNITYQSLLDEFVPLMVAYLVSQGIPQAQAEIYANLSVSTINAMPEGQEKEQAKQMSIPYLLYTWGIESTTDLSNLANSAGAIATGVKTKAVSPFSIAIGNRTEAGNSANPAAGLMAIAIGSLVKSTGENSISIGEARTYGINSFPEGSAERAYVNDFFQRLKHYGYIAEGVTDIAFGITSGNGALQLGTNNVTSTKAIAVGFANTVEGQHSASSGNMNFIGPDAINSIICGIGNICKKGSTAIFGATNGADGVENFIAGDGNRTYADLDMAIGNGVITHNPPHLRTYNQLVVGKLNHPNKDAVFQVGNGTAENARSNAFEVKSNGQVISGSETVASDNKALTTKKYVDDIFTRISGYNASVAQVLEHDASGNMIWANKI